MVQWNRIYRFSLFIYCGILHARTWNHTSGVAFTKIGITPVTSECKKILENNQIDGYDLPPVGSGYGVRPSVVRNPLINPPWAVMDMTTQSLRILVFAATFEHLNKMNRLTNFLCHCILFKYEIKHLPCTLSYLRLGFTYCRMPQKILFRQAVLDGKMRFVGLNVTAWRSLIASVNAVFFAAVLQSKQDYEFFC